MPTTRQIIGVLLGSTLAAYAQAPQSWPHEVEKLKIRLHDEIANKITLEYVATQNGLAYPLKTNKITHQEIEENSSLSAKNYVNQTIPEINQKMAFEAISEKYRQWSRRERVKFMDQRGKKYEGYMTGLYPNIRVNGITVPIVDLADEVKAHFEPYLAEKLSDREIKVILLKNSRDRNALFEEYKPKEKIRLYKSNYFTFYGGNYYEKYEVENMLAKNRDENIKNEYAGSLNSFLNKNGYILFDGDYLPIAMAIQKENERQEAQRQRQAEQERLRLEREAEQARLAAQQEQLRQQQEAERKAQEALRAQAAESCANEQIPQVINGMLQAQSRDKSGAQYWANPAAAQQLFAPVSWNIKDCSVIGTGAIAKVLIESSNRGGMPIRQMWTLYLRYENSWKISYLSGEN
jgi:hypothetical protein